MICCDNINAENLPKHHKQIIKTKLKSKHLNMIQFYKKLACLWQNAVEVFDAICDFGIVYNVLEIKLYGYILCICSFDWFLFFIFFQIELIALRTIDAVY